MYDLLLRQQIHFF